jgi:hypothetical protein
VVAGSPSVMKMMASGLFHQHIATVVTGHQNVTKSKSTVVTLHAVINNLVINTVRIVTCIVIQDSDHEILIELLILVTLVLVHLLHNQLVADQIICQNIQEHVCHQVTSEEAIGSASFKIMTNLTHLSHEQKSGIQSIMLNHQPRR